jgi:transcription elongation GreA/GreB family factor
MSHSDFKNQLLHEVNLLLQNKIEVLKHILQQIEESGENETKSSAGDKYETGVEMLKQEQNKVFTQLQQALQMQAVLSKIKPIQANRVALGALVRTSDKTFFISVSLGKVAFLGSEVFCLSMDAPICKILLNKNQGDQVVFNGKEIQILEVI